MAEASTELRVLINILQSGTGLQALLGQVNQLSLALTKLQEQADTATSANIGKDVAKDTKEASKEVDQLGKSSSSSADKLQVIEQALKRTKSGAEGVEQAVKGATNAIRLLAGGFLAFQSVQFVKTIADTAARTEVLGTVLRIVGTNAGYTTEQLDTEARAVQRLGITTQASFEALTKFIQAGLQLKNANPLARAAQDLAVLSGLDSSQTFQRLIVNIQQLDTLGLRFMGIVVSRAEADAKFAAQNNITIESMTQRQKQEALLNAVIEKARGLEGAYEAAMGNVGKQLTSLRRYYEDLRNEVGKHLLPAYSAFIAELSLFLAKMQDTAIAASANISVGERLGVVVRDLSRRFFEALEFIVKHKDALWALFAAYSAYYTVITTKRVWVIATKWVSDFTTAITINYEATKKAILATYEWVTALTVLEATKISTATRLANRPSGGRGTSLVTPAVADTTARLLNRPASGVGTAVVEVERGTTGLNIALAGLIERFVVLTKRLWEFLTPLLWLQRIGASIATAIEAIAGAIFTLGGVIAAVVLVFVGLTAIFLKFSGIGAGLVREIKNIFAIYNELAGLLNTVFFIAWRKLLDAFAAASRLAKETAREIGNLILVIDKLPGQPITRFKNALDDFNKKLEATVRQIHEVQAALLDFFGLRAERIQKQIEDVTDKIGEARTEVRNAEAEYTRVRSDQSNSPQQVKEAEDTYKAAKVIYDKLIEERDKLFKELKVVNPARYAEEVAKAEKNKWQTEFKALETEAFALDAKLKFTVQGGKIIPKEFAEQAGMLDTLVRFYKGLQKETHDTLEELAKMPHATEKAGEEILLNMNIASKRLEDTRAKTIESVRELVASVGAPNTLDPAIKRINELRKEAQTPREFELLKDAEREARVKASLFREPFDELADARQKARLKTQESVIANSLQTQLELFKTSKEEQEAVDKASYERGILTLEEFYTRRRKLSEESYKKEEAVAINSVVAIQRELREVYHPPEERRDLQAQELAALDNLEKLRESHRKENLALDLEERDAQFKAGKQVYDSELKNLALFGDQNAARAEINNRYEEQLIAMGKTEDAQARATNDEERLQELYKLDKDFRAQALEAEIERTRAQRDALTYAQAFLDLEKQRTTLLTQRGDIGTFEAQQIRNGQLLRQQGLDRVLLKQKEHDLDLKSQVLAADLLAFEQRFLESKGLTLLSPEEVSKLKQTPAYLNAIRKEFGGVQDEVTRLQVEIVNLNGKIQLVGLQLENFGDDLKKNFIDSFANALTQSITNFRNAGKVFIDLSTSITNEIVGIFAKAFSERLFKRLGIFNIVDRLLNKIFGAGGFEPFAPIPGSGGFGGGFAEGGKVSGPGSGTSDSIPAMLSHGEHVMPADKTAQFLPLLEGIRTGKILPFAKGGVVQSIAISPVIPKRYAGGGIVMHDAGASSVQTGSAPSNLMVTLHPDTLNMTMREWLEHEVVRQQGRR